MITTYHRPQTLEEALKILTEPDTRPLGGGTVLANLGAEEAFSVVDLQSLGLGKLHKSGNILEIGATVTLQDLLENEHTPGALKSAIKIEAPINLRNMATVAGVLATCDGLSPFAVVMQALDARIMFLNGGESHIDLGDMLANKREVLQGKLIVKIEAPINLRNMATVAGILATCDGLSPFAVVMQALDARITFLNGGESHIDLGDMLANKRETLQGKLIIRIEIPLSCMLAFESVARSPADKPIICVALAKWPSGRTKVVLGGWGELPTLAMDGNDSSGILEAIKYSTQNATDAWGSVEYRSSVAGVLVRRCIENINRVSSLGTKV